MRYALLICATIGTTACGSASSDTRPTATAKAYAATVIVRDVHVEERSGQYVTVAGELKNPGDRTLDALTITVVFFDKDGRAMSEREVLPFLVNGIMGDTAPLRPGLSKTFRSVQRDIPSEWAGGVSASVTDVTFAP